MCRDLLKQSTGPVNLYSESSNMLKKESVDICSDKIYTRSVITVLLYPAQTTQNQKTSLTSVIWALLRSTEMCFVPLRDPEEAGRMS